MSSALDARAPPSSPGHAPCPLRRASGCGRVVDGCRAPCARGAPRPADPRARPRQPSAPAITHAVRAPDTLPSSRARHQSATHTSDIDRPHDHRLQLATRPLVGTASARQLRCVADDVAEDPHHRRPVVQRASRHPGSHNRNAPRWCQPVQIDARTPCARGIARARRARRGVERADQRHAWSHPRSRPRLFRHSNSRSSTTASDYTRNAERISEIARQIAGSRLSDGAYCGSHGKTSCTAPIRWPRRYLPPCTAADPPGRQPRGPSTPSPRRPPRRTVPRGATRVRGGGECGRFRCTVSTTPDLTLERWCLQAGVV